MAPVIWGLNLAEIHWSKFKSSYMWSRRYHLRRTKFIVYQLAMIFCVVSESLGTASLSDYIDQQEAYAKLNNQATEYNDDMVGVGSYNIFAGVFVATIFGAGFFFDLFWPERHESKSVRLAWKICAILACLFTTGSVIAMTVIVSSHCAYVTGVNAQEVAYIVRTVSGVPLCYRKEGRAVAAVVFDWLGWPFVIVSTVVLFMSHAHDEVYGPLSTNALAAEQAKAKSETIYESTPVGSDPEAVPTMMNTEKATGMPVHPPPVAAADSTTMARWDRQMAATEPVESTYPGT